MQKRPDKYPGGNITDTGDDTGGFSPGKQTFSSFKNPVYLIYYGALLCQMAAMNMQMLTRYYLLYDLTGSALTLGYMSLANALPMLLLSLFGGAIADRVQKKYVMLVGQACSAVVSLGIAFALVVGYLSFEHPGSWWILVVASVFQGTIMGLMMPSRQAILPEIVGEDNLMNAVSLNSMGTNILRIMAPALTGRLIDSVGYAAVYFVTTGMYILAVAFVIFLPLTSTISIRGGGALTSIKEGLQYLRHKTTILLILVFILFAVVLSMPYQLLMPIFAKDILKVGATGMGDLITASGVGAIITSIVLASLPNRKRGLMLIASCLIMSLALMAFSFSSTWYLSLGVIVFVGLGSTGRMTLGNTLIQYYVDDDYRGRVMSIYMMEFGLVSFGTFAAGVMAESMGVQWVVGGFAATLFVIALLVMVFVPRIRNLD